MSNPRPRASRGGRLAKSSRLEHFAPSERRIAHDVTRLSAALVVHDQGGDTVPGRTGYLPDLETFRKTCEWLGVDPGDVLRSKNRGRSADPIVAVHFKKDSALAPETAQALASLVVAAQRALMTTDGERD